MINVEVRTLNCGNYYFTLEDQSTVLALKYKIRDSLHIELHEQRLIHRGSVLADDFNLIAIDADDRVIHMVYKEPPSSTTVPMSGHSRGPYSLGPSEAGPSKARTSRAGPPQAGPSGYQVPYEQVGPEMMNNSPYILNDTDQRLLSINKLILDINEQVYFLEQPSNENSDNTYMRPRQREITRAQTPQDYIDMRTALDTTLAQIEPLKRRFTQMQRAVVNNDNTNDYSFHSQFRLHCVWEKKMQAIDHSLAHVYHALSELSLIMDESNVLRLVSEPAPNATRPPLQLESIRDSNIQHLDLGMENASANANQEMEIDLEHGTTFILSSQTPLGDRNDLVNLPPETTQQIVVGTLDFNSFLGSNPHPGEEVTCIDDRADSSDDEASTMVVPGSDDDQNDTDSYNSDEVRFIMSPVTRNLPNLIYDRFLFCDSRHAHDALEIRRKHAIEELKQQRETLTNMENSLRAMIDYVPGLTQVNSLLTEIRSIPASLYGLEDSNSSNASNAQDSTPIIDLTDDPVPTSDMSQNFQVISDDEDSTVGRRPMDSTTADAQSVITLSDEEPDLCIITSPSNVPPPSGSSSVSENGDAKATNASDAPEHNWKQSYVPIFNLDEVAQRAGGSNEPLSDAYLAGMPASRRRCVRRQRPPCNLEDFLTACVDAAGDSSHMTENDMRLALSAHMCNLGYTRFSSNENVNEGATSGRFIYVRRYFNSHRPAPRGDDSKPSSSNHKDA